MFKRINKVNNFSYCDNFVYLCSDNKKLKRNENRR